MKTAKRNKKNTASPKANQKIQRGRVKNTENQIKKHVSQMTPEEKAFISKRLKMVYANYKWHPHFLNSSRLFNMLTVERLLISPNITDCIIEYNQRGDDKRVLLRSTFSSHVTLEKDGESYEADANLCLVIDIYTGVIVTAYWNEANDHHDNVNMKRYTADLKICS